MNKSNFFLLQFVLVFSLINSCIELEISAPSFIAIAKYFGVSELIISHTITVNLAGFCIGALIYGPLSDCFGRRKVMIFGNLLLVISAFGCVLAIFTTIINIILILSKFGSPRPNHVGLANSPVELSSGRIYLYSMSSLQKSQANPPMKS